MEKQLITKDEAIEIMESWADYFILEHDDEDFVDAKKALLPAVRSQRLSFDEDKEVFTFALFNPIVLTNSKREVVEIKSLKLSEKRVMEKFKDNEKISMAEAIYAKAAGLSIAEASALEGRDFSVIVAVNTVFFS